MMRIEKLEKKIILGERQKLRVAAYVRVSVASDMSVKSLDNQAETYEGQIRKNPEWEFAGIYEDKGISGTKEMRPAFQQMLSDCRAGKIDLILTKSFTRFARNTVVLLNTLRELKELGIEVIFEKDNIRSFDESGEVLITLLAAFAQAESYSASENQKWRIRKAFKEGRITNGGRMLGYCMKDKKLTVIPKEAETVRMIFTDYLSGLGIRAIANKLNDMNIKTIHQKRWYPCSVRIVLGNEKYTGDLLLQKNYVADYISKKNVKNRGERTQYYVNDDHEAIIPKKMFTAVQAEIAARRQKQDNKYPWIHKQVPFSGLLVCGKCGRRYWRCSSSQNRASWQCSTRSMWGKDACNNKAIEEKTLISKTVEVLGADDLSTAIPAMLKEIQILDKGQLKYLFLDGTEQTVQAKKIKGKEVHHA